MMNRTSARCYQLALVPCLLGMALVTAACQPTIEGNGIIEDRRAAFSGASRIVLGNSLRASFRLQERAAEGDTARVELDMSLDENLYDHLRLRRNGGTVEITTRNDVHLDATVMRIDVMATGVHALRVHDAASAELKDTKLGCLDLRVEDASRLRTNDLEVGRLDAHAEDASDLHIDGLYAAECTLIAEDASRVEVQGDCRDGTLRAHDASSLSARHFSIDSLELRVANASSLSATVIKDVYGSVTDASSALIYGDPPRKDVSARDASKVSYR